MGQLHKNELGYIHTKDLCKRDVIPAEDKYELHTVNHCNERASNGLILNTNCYQLFLCLLCHSSYFGDSLISCSDPLFTHKFVSIESREEASWVHMSFLKYRSVFVVGTWNCIQAKEGFRFCQFHYLETQFSIDVGVCLLKPSDSRLVSNGRIACCRATDWAVRIRDRSHTHVSTEEMQLLRAEFCIAW
jgi:hypothetical protein